MAELDRRRRGGYRCYFALALLAGIATGCTGSIEPGATAGSGGGAASGSDGSQANGSGGSSTGSGGSGADAAVSGTSSDSTSSTTAGGGSGGSGGDRTAVTFECDPETAPSATPLTRLARGQYENSLRALFEPMGLEAAVTGAESAFEQLPPDGENESVYSGNDHRVTQRHVDAYLGIADSIAGSVTGDESSLVSLAGECAGEDSVEEACVRAFVTDFGERVFRRPLEEGEIDRYLELYDENVAGAEVFRGIVLQLLMSPRFLYHFEIEGEELEANQDHLLLAPYELASRLAYHFWQSPPDAELYAAAEDGSIMTDAGFEAQVERLFDDERTRASVTRFWREWYQLDGFAGFADTPAFSAFLEGDSADADLYSDMLDEVDRLLDYYTFQTAGTYRDVLSSPLIVTPSERLASLYGVEPWDGTGEFPEFAGSERSGLLTRAALLVAGNELTNPIKRGAFVLRSLLCDDLHPPSNLPAEALALPEADAELSTRERYELKTSPVACAGCHAVLNPYGFVLEAYDALGRYRTEEKIYSDSGELENAVPIDTAAEVILGTETSSVTNAVEFSEQLAASGIADDCFARQYFRYTYRRDEATGDSCALAAIRDNVAPGGSLKQALRDVALSPSFRQRVIGPR